MRLCWIVSVRRRAAKEEKVEVDDTSFTSIQVMKSCNTEEVIHIFPNSFKNFKGSFFGNLRNLGPCSTDLKDVWDTKNLGQGSSYYRAEGWLGYLVIEARITCDVDVLVLIIRNDIKVVFQSILTNSGYSLGFMKLAFLMFV